MKRYWLIIGIVAIVLILSLLGIVWFLNPPSTSPSDIFQVF